MMLKRLLLIITVVALVSLPFLNNPKVTIESSGSLSIGTNTVLAAGEEELVESTWMRTKNSKVFHSYGIPNKDYHDIYLDAIHYEVGHSREIVEIEGPETIYWTTWEDIDNTLESAGELSPWDWQMVKADYNVYFLEDFTHGQILKFEKADPYGTVLGNVAFQPMALQWTNDLDQVHEVSMPQSGVLSTVDNRIQWEDAYGSSIDFSWTCTSTRLLKVLTIDSLGNLPTPEQYILEGGNPVLRLDFIFDPSSELDIYVDGGLWNKKSDFETFGTIEFKLGDETLWGFMPMWVWDSSGSNELSVVQKLERVGGKLFVSVRVPYEWIQNAAFPIYIDAVVDESVETSSDDACELVADGSMDLADTIIDLGSYTSGATHAGFRFIGIDTTDVENVETAYLEFCPASGDSGAVSYTWYGEDVASATTFTTTDYDISNRTRTTASVTENPPINWAKGTWTQSVDLSSILNEVFSRGDWVSGNDLAILNIYNSGNGERRLRAWDYNDHTKAPKLHFENPTEVTYYFNHHMSPPYDEWGDTDNIVDNNLATFGYETVDTDEEGLDTNTCPGTDLGSITKVELRLYAYGDGNDRIDIWPWGSPGLDGTTEHQTTPTASGPTGDWGTYVEITNDPEAPSPWTWAAVVAQDCYIEYDKVGQSNTMYCAKVEIRVTYWAPPVSDIDVGSIPIDRTGPMPTVSETIVDKGNPANASGTLHSIKVWASASITDLRVGTFYTTNGNTLKYRDSVLIGAVEAGAERTFTELSITVVEGDYIGCYHTDGFIEYDESGGSGLWYYSGESIDPNDEAEYTFTAGYAISLYGYGDIGACSPNIGNLPISYDFGVVAESSTPSTTINYFTVTNSSGGAVSITIQGTDMLGGTTWALSDTATPGTNIYGLKCGLDDDDDNFDIIVKKNPTYNDLVSGLADSGEQDWGLQFLAPSSMDDDAEKTCTVTVTATCD